MLVSLRSSLVLLFLVVPPAVRAQGTPDPLRLADSLSKAINNAHLAGDRAALEAARRLLDRATTLFPRDGLLLHYKGYAIYRVVQESPELPPDAKAPLITQGLGTLEASARLKPLAETHILRRGLLAQTISDAGSAMVVAPQMEQELADAMRLGKTNPRVWLVQGIGTFFTPEMWGGGAAAALVQLSEAERLFRNDHPAQGLPAWGLAELHAWLGVVHQKLGHADAARRGYQEAVRIEPGFAWVKAVLLPGLERGVQPFPEVP